MLAVSSTSVTGRDQGKKDWREREAKMKGRKTLELLLHKIP